MLLKHFQRVIRSISNEEVLLNCRLNFITLTVHFLFVFKNPKVILLRKLRVLNITAGMSLENITRPEVKK